MSRFAYPASSAREDVSFHGSASAHAEMQHIIERELREGRMVGLVTLGGKVSGNLRRNAGTLCIFGEVDDQKPLAAYVRPVSLDGDFMWAPILARPPIGQSEGVDIPCDVAEAKDDQNKGKGSPYVVAEPEPTVDPSEGVDSPCDAAEPRDDPREGVCTPGDDAGLDDAGLSGDPGEGVDPPVMLATLMTLTTKTSWSPLTPKYMLACPWMNGKRSSMRAWWETVPLMTRPIYFFRAIWTGKRLRWWWS